MTGAWLSRDQLIQAAWGRGMAITDRAVDTHVFNLRKKMRSCSTRLFLFMKSILFSRT